MPFPTLAIKDGNNAAQTINTMPNAGAATAANSLPVAVATDQVLTIVGNIASGATDSGNGVKGAGVYQSTQPTLTNGQRGDFQVDTRSNFKVVLFGADSINPAQLLSLNADGVSAATRGLWVGSNNFRYNGGGWDREKKPSSNSRLVASAATTNATSVKASAGDVFKIKGNNTTASKRYIKLYNKASAPVVGTDTPYFTDVIPASGPFEINFPTPLYFSTGIAYAITGAAADSDTTAIGAGDIECLNISYA